MIVVIGAVESQLWWWVARSSGMVAWALVTASILWGLTLSTKLIRRRGIPAWLLDLHRYLGTLSLVFTGVHLLALWADSYVHFGPRELFVPFASSWRARAVAWGIASFYLLIAIELTSWVMRWLPRKVWHAVHLSSIALFVGATVHTFLAGADRTNLLLQWFVFTSVVAVVFLIVFRSAAPKRALREAPATAAPIADVSFANAKPPHAARAVNPAASTDELQARLAALSARGRASR